MRFSALAVLPAFARLGASSHLARRHQHNHAHLHARDYETTVVETVTDWVTTYVYADELTTTASSSSSNVDGIFIQGATTTSSTTSTTPTSTTPTTTSTSSSTTSTTPTSTTSTTSLPVTSTSSATGFSILGIHTTLSTAVVQTSSATTPYITSAATVTVQTSNSLERTFTIINSHTTAISTLHDDTSGTPTSAGAPLTAGTIAAGATATFAVPVDWIGNMGINEAQYPVTEDSTLLEGNYSPWFGIPRADFDISFVNGFTLPATCSCDGEVTTGCNLDLLALGTCPTEVEDGACANPLRAIEAAVEAVSFFAACEGAAWTFVNDGDADSNCPSGDIVCCVGTACPANPKQSSS